MKVLLILTCLVWCSYGLQPSPGCGQATETPQPGDHQWFNFVYEDKRLGPVERAFIIQIPPGYDDLTPLPLLFDVHWYGGSAGSHYDMSPFTQMGLDEISSLFCQTVCMTQLLDQAHGTVQVLMDL